MITRGPARHARRALLVGLVLVWPLTSCGRKPAVDTTQVSSRSTPTAPVGDPDALAWLEAPECPAKLMVQDVTEPRLMAPGAELLRVRSLHDDKAIAFRLEWDDETESVIPESGRGSDAVAIQFPLVGGSDVPDPAMGEPGKAVRIWYWKSVWQDDDARASSGGGDRVTALYPRASIDHYPFQAASLQTDPSLAREVERRYAPARAVGNPIAARPPGRTVQVLMAEGFGNTSVAPQQDGTGLGRYRAGRWVTIITRPIDAGRDLAPLTLGARSYLAVAVWDGAAGHTGSRKMRSGWIPLVVSR